MSDGVTMPAAPISLPERPPPFPRVTMGSFEVPEVEPLVELSKHLPETDGVPLETIWHRFAADLLIDTLSSLWRERNDFFVGANQFIYYSVRRVRNVDFVGPDYFVVTGVDRHRPREFWVVWEEGGKYPDLIVELLSETTAEVDRTTKKALYEQTFHTPEYFCYDPATNRLEGWRLQGQRYHEIAPDSRGWLWSDVLQLWLGTWTGEFFGLHAVWLRYYDAAGQLVPTWAEAERQKAEAARQRAEAERLRAEAEQQRAEAERQRAEEERLRAEAERQRAEAAEEELARLRARLAELERGGPEAGSF